LRFEKNGALVSLLASGSPKRQKVFCHFADVKKLIYARILGYLMLEEPSDEACVAIAREILSCTNEHSLPINGKMYYDHYIHAPVDPT
jgi:hypothetical protein